MNGTDVRSEILARWDQAARGWGQRAERVRQLGMPVSLWMIEHAGLQPGQRVLELAAGPGDTGFLAAELIAPGGTLVSSDASEKMLELARTRARQMAVDNVEFRQLQLEWIDLPAASADTVLCRWGLMLCVDPPAALKEIRRVLRPGGRAALAVWDVPERNPWATVPGRAIVELGHASPPDPNAPGMFALSAPGLLQTLLEEAGFIEMTLEEVELERTYRDLEEWIVETHDLSMVFSDVYDRLDEQQRGRLRQKMVELAEPHMAEDGSLRLRGRSLVAATSA